MNLSPVIIFVGAGLAGLSASALLDRVIIPRLAKRGVAKILVNINAGRVPKKTDCHQEICFDENGFSVVHLKKSEAIHSRMNWSDVCESVAFKRDLFNVDLVCLLLRRADGFGVEVDEDMKGWNEFIAALPSYLPTCRPWEQWFLDVAHPAFATNATEIFSRRKTKTDNSAELV